MSTSKITAQEPTKYCFTESQLDSIYIGLKQGGIRRYKLKECNNTAKELNNLLQSTNDSLNRTSIEIKYLNSEVQNLQSQLIAKKPTVWYKKWWLWLSIGIVSGAVLK